jgi:secretion/DNA translocation related TadE-like protein
VNGCVADGAGGISDRGSISVVAAAVIGLTLVCSVGVADVAKVLVARAHAQAAADSAALAAAQELAFASGRPPSALAGEFARRNGAALLGCACDRGTTQAIVHVALPVGHLLLVPGRRTVDAWARAVVDLPGVPQG